MQFAGRPQDCLGLWGGIHPHLCCEARKGRGGRWRVESGYGPVMATSGAPAVHPCTGSRLPPCMESRRSTASDVCCRVMSRGMVPWQHHRLWAPTDRDRRPWTHSPSPNYFTEGSSKVWEGRLQGHPAGVWPGRTGHQCWPLFGQRSLHPTRLESGGRGEYWTQEGEGVPSVVHTTIP